LATQFKHSVVLKFDAITTGDYGVSECASVLSTAIALFTAIDVGISPKIPEPSDKLRTIAGCIFHDDRGFLAVSDGKDGYTSYVKCDRLKSGDTMRLEMDGKECQFHKNEALMGTLPVDTKNENYYLIVKSSDGSKVTIESYKRE